jgi:hypothetical protein
LFQDNDFNRLASAFGQIHQQNQNPNQQQPQTNYTLQQQQQLLGYGNVRFKS